MKNSSKILLLSLGGLVFITLVVLFLSRPRGHTNFIFYGDNQRISDDGKAASQNYSFADQPFDSIVLKGTGKMEAQVTHKQHTANATITTNSNLLPYVDVYVRNKTLYISKKDHIYFHSKTKIKIMVNADDLKSISTYGSGDSIINNINTDKFSAETYGSGNTTLQGRAKKLSIKIRGSGDINTKNLNAEDVEASIYGSGDIVTNATKKINADIHGSGSIEYYGNPQKVSQSIAGSGKILAIGR